MKLFDKSKNKVEKETDEEINCDICGITLKSYLECENKKVCEKCFFEINED